MIFLKGQTSFSLIFLFLFFPPLVFPLPCIHMYKSSLYQAGHYQQQHNMFFWLSHHIHDDHLHHHHHHCYHHHHHHHHRHLRFDVSLCERGCALRILHWRILAQAENENLDYDHCNALARTRWGPGCVSLRLALCRIQVPVCTCGLISHFSTWLLSLYRDTFGRGEWYFQGILSLARSKTKVSRNRRNDKILWIWQEFPFMLHETIFLMFRYSPSVLLMSAYPRIYIEADYNGTA